jgi:hypothetical protein
MTLTALVLLWVFTIVLGLDLGAGFYETRVNLAGWAKAFTSRTADGDAYMRFSPSAGKRLWMVLTPLTGLVAFATLISAIQTRGPVRPWMIGASGLELAVVATTLGWFAPNIIRLLNNYLEMHQGEVVSMVRVWVSLNRVRVGLTLVAWLAALRAMTLSAAG